jgi:hypothetical protein
MPTAGVALDDAARHELADRFGIVGRGIEAEQLGHENVADLLRRNDLAPLA